MASGRYGEPLNEPITHDFWLGLEREVAFQQDHYGPEHDERKTAADWYWTLSYLAGKALYSYLAGDKKKALHHCISSAALLCHWHKMIQKEMFLEEDAERMNLRG